MINFKKILLLFIPGFQALHAHAEHSTISRQHLLEIVIANTHSSRKDLFTTGLEYEYFPEAYHGSFSFGVSADVEHDDENEYFLGPLFSYYPNHKWKFFYSFGPFWNKGNSYLLQRIGTGYEIHLKHYNRIIPTINFDFVEGEVHTVIGIGFAHSF